MAGGRVGIVIVSCKSDDEHTLSLYLPRMAKVELRACVRSGRDGGYWEA